MKYRIAAQKIDSPGGSPLSWNTATVRRIADHLGSLVESCGFDFGAVHNASVLLHPNLVRPHRSRPASFTDPRVILASVDLFRQAGASKVMVGENPGFGFPARQAFAEAGLVEPLQQSGATLLFFDEGEWVTAPNSEGRLYRNILIAKPVLDADIFINIPKMKTHMLTQISVCIKNLLGVIHDDQRILFHRNDIADKVVDLNLVRPPELNIVDALWPMEGQAPFHGRAIEEFNVLVTGIQSAAVDALCCDVMGFEVHEVPHVQLGVKRLLPEWDTDRSIDLTGDPLKHLKRRFARPVLSSMGQFDAIDCIECGVCNGCLSAIRHSLDWMTDETGLKNLDSYTVVSGRPMPNQSTLQYWKGELILFGNCAAEFQFFDAARRQKATWIPGCPPHVLDLAKLLKNKQKKANETQDH